MRTVQPRSQTQPLTQKKKERDQRERKGGVSNKNTVQEEGYDLHWQHSYTAPRFMSRFKKTISLIALVISIWVFSLFLHNLSSIMSSAGAMATEQPAVFRAENDILVQLASGAISEPIVKVDLTNRGLTTFPNEVYFRLYLFKMLF